MKKSELNSLPTHLVEGRFAKFDDKDPVIQAIVSAQGRARTKLLKVFEVHDLHMSNRLKTPLANMLASKGFAEKALAEVLPALDRQREATKAEIKKLQRTIEDSLEAGALRWNFATETREYVRSLPTAKDREKFIADALARGERLAAAAVLGVPAYLSGLSETSQKLFLHRYKAEAFPDVVARTEALTKAQDILDDGGQSMISEVQKLFDQQALNDAEGHVEKIRAAEVS